MDDVVGLAARHLAGSVKTAGAVMMQTGAAAKTLGVGAVGESIARIAVSVLSLRADKHALCGKCRKYRSVHNNVHCDKEYQCRRSYKSSYPISPENLLEANFFHKRCCFVSHIHTAFLLSVDYIPFSVECC